MLLPSDLHEGFSQGSLCATFNVKKKKNNNKKRASMEFGYEKFGLILIGEK